MRSTSLICFCLSCVLMWTGDIKAVKIAFLIKQPLPLIYFAQPYLPVWWRFLFSSFLCFILETTCEVFEEKIMPRRYILRVTSPKSGLPPACWCVQVGCMWIQNRRPTVLSWRFGVMNVLRALGNISKVNHLNQRSLSLCKCLDLVTETGD